MAFDFDASAPLGPAAYLFPAKKGEFTGFKAPAGVATFQDMRKDKIRAVQTAMQHDEDMCDLKEGLDHAIPDGVTTGEDAAVFMMKGDISTAPSSACIR